MRVFKSPFFVLFLGITLLWGCRDIYELEKYQRPDWLAGKIYTQITTLEDLTQFANCLRLTGYDTILDISGSYTVFAPTDEAFEQWFSQHPEYNGSFENIPPQDLENLVERHILQNAWSLKQLQSLDIYGWIDPNDPDNNKPRGYKRQTIQRDADKKYFIKPRGDRDQIVDSTQSNSYKKVWSKSRKYAPIFFDDYFPINDLRADDYEFYYKRSFESGNLFFGNSKIINPEIFAENGFIHVVDKVTDPLFNAEQIMHQDDPLYSYKSFRETINLFSLFLPNMEATILQPEAKAGGGSYDTLYNLIFPELVFNQQEELTGPNTSFTNYTVRYQNAVLAPTDDAFQRFLDEVVTSKSGYPHWSDYESVPIAIKSIIVNAHMADKPVYRTNITQGFRNGANDFITIDEANIVQTYYGSNCSFIGLNEAIIPRAFSSITGPVYLRPGYSTIQYAMEYTKTLSALKEEQVDYSFYVQSDELLSVDSSLLLVWVNRANNSYRFRGLNQNSGALNNFNPNVLTKRILNQVGTKQAPGFANKEFIENLAGNFIVVNHSDNTVTGGLPNTFGYNGDSLIYWNPVQLEELTDNGKTYDAGGWFRMPTTTMTAHLTLNPHFFNLINQAGLYDNVFATFPFLTEGAFYTVFMPTPDALANYNTDTLSRGELQDFVKHHFVRGERIWTDGSSPDGYYETLRLDESSTPFIKKYSTHNIDMGADLIRILDKDGSPYVEIPEQQGVTNIMIATDTDENSNSVYDFQISGVIHHIDTVLIKQ